MTVLGYIVLTHFNPIFWLITLGSTHFDPFGLQLLTQYKDLGELHKNG